MTKDKETPEQTRIKRLEEGLVLAIRSLQEKLTDPDRLDLTFRLREILKGA
jgi:hypothetical protein